MPGDAVTLAISLSSVGNVLLVAFGIGLVIFVHELGHFLAARRMKVHVEIFSLGFGPRLVGFVHRGTDYRLSLVPMGGYVKVAGEMPEEGAGSPDELVSRGVGQRALYYSGGVIMNLLFGLAVFPVVFAVGVPMREPTIGSVTPGGPAWKAGLREGDVVQTAGGHELLAWEDLILEVALGDPDRMEIAIERDGRPLTVRVAPSYDEARGFSTIEADPSLADTLEIDAAGPAARAGLTGDDRILAIDGAPLSDDGLRSLMPQPEAVATLEPRALTVVGPADEAPRTIVVVPEARDAEGRFVLGIRAVQNVVAALREGFAEPAAPLREGDVVVRAGGRDVRTPDEIREALTARDAGAPFELVIERDDGRHEVTLDPDLAAACANDVAFTSPGESPSGVPVVVTPGSAAAAAGLVSGERLVAVNDHATLRWRDILERMEEADGEPVALRVRGPDGSLRTVDVAPRPAVILDYGVVPRAAYTTRRFSWSEAFTAGLHSSWNLARQFYLTLRKMLVREVSTKNLGGIVAISNVSYHFAQLGLAKLFFFLALLSIQLAFINVLPIPVLDGGHLLFLGIEKVKGSPVSERVVGYAQVVGLVIVLSLLIYVTFNDIERLLR